MKAEIPPLPACSGAALVPPFWVCAILATAGNVSAGLCGGAICHESGAWRDAGVRSCGLQEGPVRVTRSLAAMSCGKSCYNEYFSDVSVGPESMDMTNHAQIISHGFYGDRVLTVPSMVASRGLGPGP